MLIKNIPIHQQIKGIIHIGAHQCEERKRYKEEFNIGDDKTIWIEANPDLVDKMKKKNPKIKIFNACVADKDNETVSFMVTNNFQSSSILNLKTHLQEHPQVVETHRITLKTKTIQNFYKENKINQNDYNFMNLDIQGAELLALKGAGDILKNFNYIYTEVNEKELYENCALLPQLDEYLQKFGFKRTQTKMTQYGWGDALYIK